MMRGDLREQRRGAVLIVTVIMLLGLTVILSAYLAMVRLQTRWHSDRHSQEQSLYLAEAGLNRVVWYLMNNAPDGSTDGSWRTAAYPSSPGPGPNDPRQEAFAGGDFTLWVESSGGQVLITARGDYAGLTRTVQQAVIVTAGSPPAVDPVFGTWREI